MKISKISERYLSEFEDAVGRFEIAQDREGSDKQPRIKVKAYRDQCYGRLERRIARLEAQVKHDKILIKIQQDEIASLRSRKI